MKRRSTQPFVFLLACLACIPMSTACVEEARPTPPRPSGDDDGGVVRPPATILQMGPCTDGDTKECSVILGVHNDIVSCFHGVQLCKGGAWGQCTDGMIVETAAVPGAVGSGAATLDAGAPPSP